MTTNSTSMKPDAVPALTGLRFIAALCVLLAHALPKIFPVNDPAMPAYIFMQSLALIGMPLFFVLSGFVIQYNYAAQIQTQGVTGIYNFFVARFARLYPLFLLCLLFDLVNKWSYASLPAQTTKALPFYFTLTHSWFYQAYDKTSLIAIFGWLPQVSWSISAEWFFYLGFPLICLVLQKINSLRILALAFAITAVVSMAIVIFIGLHEAQINTIAVAHFGPLADSFGPNKAESLYQWLLSYSPYPRLCEFTLGCMTAKAYLMTARNIPSAHEQKIALTVTLLAIGTIMLMVVFMRIPGFAPDGRFKFIITLRYVTGFAVPIAVLLFCCARYHNLVTRALSTKYMLLCGEISFSIYMMHMLIIGAFRWEAATVTSWEIGVSNTLRVVVVIAATIGLSLVTYTLIEMPAKKWLTRKLRRRPPSTPASPANS